MKNLLVALALLFTASSALAQQVGPCKVVRFDTQAGLEASSWIDCTIAYALDNDVLEIRANGAWVGLSPTTTSLTGANGGTFANSVNNHWTMTELGENGDVVFSNNLVTFTSTTGALYAFTPAVAFADDITASGGAGALTFNSAASSIVTTDNSATGLIIGSVGALSIATVDTRDGAEGLIVTGYVTVSTTLGVTGVATLGAGAGALTLTNTAASVLVNDNDSTALDIGSTGTTAGLRYSSLDNREALTVSSAGFLATPSAVDAVSRTLDESDCGKVMLFSAAFDGQIYTLPAAAAATAGCTYTFSYTGAAAGALLTVTPNASDGIYGQGHGSLVVSSGANTACSTTCSANLCRGGYDIGTTTLTNCASALSDSCFCDEAALSGADAASVKITKATIKKGDMLRIICDGVDGWYVIGNQGSVTN